MVDTDEGNSHRVFWHTKNMYTGILTNVRTCGNRTSDLQSQLDCIMDLHLSQFLFSILIDELTGGI